MARTFVLAQRLVHIFGIIHILQWAISDLSLSIYLSLSLSLTVCIRPLGRRIEEKKVAAYPPCKSVGHRSPKFNFLKEILTFSQPPSLMFPLHTHGILSLKLLKILIGRRQRFLYSQTISLGPTDLRLSTEIQGKLLLFSFQLSSIPLRRHHRKEGLVRQLPRVGVGWEASVRDARWAFSPQGGLHQAVKPT